MLLGTAPSAHAAELWYYWYGGGSNNCWQTGQFGSQSEFCDNVSEHFLEVPGRLVSDSTNGGIGEDTQRANGDYCSYYGLGSPLNQQDPNDESRTTGFGTPAPYGSYQEWDGNGNVCQANGPGFGQEVRHASCTAKTCGMHHYVSFHQQEYKNRPWSKFFRNPSLIVTAQATIQTLSGSSPGAWGYICPLFQDAASPHNILEYCFQEWRGSGNAKPEWEDERIGTCAGGPSNNNIDTVQTFFYPGTQFATIREGSATTGVASAGWKFYTALITEANLKNAIELDRKEYKHKSGSGSEEATPELGYGCGRSAELSTNPQEYALIGVEQGAEGWNFSELGAGGTTIWLHTEYTPLPPEVKTEGASNVSRSGATLAGTINPEGQITNYHYEYGPTTSYGHTTATRYAGAGTSSVATEEIISELAPGTTYYYRLVAESSRGTTDGEHGSFTTKFSGSATTGTASEVEGEQATLNGTVNPAERRTLYWFEYGTSIPYAHRTAQVEAGLGEKPLPVKAKLTGLALGAAYHYRLVAESPEWGEEFDGEDATFTTLGRQCEGTNITGQGASLQAIAQDSIWGPAFNTSLNETACSGSQGTGGKPVATYTSTGSDAGLEAFGAEGGTPNYGQTAFVGTDEAPNAKQKEEIESHAKLGSEERSLETIPVLQSALAIIVHLPEGCRGQSEVASGTKVIKLGRLVFDDATLEGIYRGTIKTWKEAVEHQKGDGNDKLSCTGGVTEEELEIKRVVRKDHAGTTHILKSFLRQVNNAPFKAEAYAEQIGGKSTRCGTAFPAEEEKSWSEVSEGCQNQRWPAAANVIRPAEGGDPAIITEVADVASSIGYANLAAVREYGGFSKKGVGGENVKGTETKVGEQNTKFWAEIQNSYSPGTKYADPSSTGDVDKAANANCAGTIYETFPTEKFPPKSTREPWYEVKAELVQTNYALCGLTYDLALRRYSAYPGATFGESTTARNYLLFTLNTKTEGGGALIKSHDYEKVSSAVLKESESGAHELGF